MNELSKHLLCIRLKSGVEIWAESERVVNLQTALRELKNHFFVEYDGQTINTAEIEGIFTAQTMEELTRRKNGEWQCRKGTWHGRKERCECAADSICPLCKKDKADTWSNEGKICFNCYKNPPQK